jgi:hypothetical protein
MADVPGMTVAGEKPVGGITTAMLPLVVISQFGGADRNVAQDVVNVDVDVYVGPDVDGNPRPVEANDLSELLRTAYLRHLPGYYTDTATVSDVRTISRPCARPYDDSNSPMRRNGAAYSFHIKSRG